MILLDKMKNFKIYKNQTFLPTVYGNKKKGSAILLFTPNYESSRKIMENKMFINSSRYSSYYLERDISYYINDNTVEDVNENVIIEEQKELQSFMEMSSAERKELPDEAFGIPSKRKYPLDTEAHVRSAIKFFNYVDEEDGKELAMDIISAMKKFGIYGKIKVSSKNRFSKYYKEPVTESTGLGKAEHGQILTPLQFYYYLWKYGTIDEKEARKKIYQIRSTYHANKPTDTPDTIPNPDEWFKNAPLNENAMYFVESKSDKIKRKNDKGEDVPELCPKCGNKVGIFIHGEPIWKCCNKDCNKVFGVVPFNESTNYKSNELVTNLMNEDVMNLGDKMLFFNEASKKTPNDSRLKKLLYASRIKNRKELLLILDKVKADIPFIKYAFPDMKKYTGRNLFVDLYYYNAIFFQNNNWVLQRGLSLYIDFMTRLINHPNLKQNGYNYKTIFIPVSDWDKLRDGSVWNMRKSINPISCIYQMMNTAQLGQLKKIFGKNNIVFIASDKYFKINFSEIDAKDLKRLTQKFKLFCIKICRNEEFDMSDIDTTGDNVDSSEVIQAKLIDKIEKSKGIDLTPHVASAITKKNLNPAKNIDTSNTLVSKVSVGDVDVTSQDKATTDKINNNKFRDDSENYGDEGESQRDKDVETLAAAIAKASEDNDNEDDAEDDLDDDEIKRILTDLSGEDDAVNISASRAARITELDEKLMKKQIKGKTVKEILADESVKKENSTTINVASPNTEEWSNLTYMNFDKNYNIDKDIINIFRHFSKCTRPISIRDINVTDNSTSEDRVALYDVDMEDYRGKRFRIKLDIPIMEDNRFLLRGNFKSVQTQFFNIPIIKTDLDTCQLISNYKKIFLRRFGSTTGKSLPIVARIIKAANKYSAQKGEKIIKFSVGDNTKICSKYQLPIDYIDISTMFTTIETPEWIVYFNQDEIRSKYTIEEGKGFPFAYNKKLNAVEYFSPKIKDSFAKMLYLNLIKIDSKFEEFFAKATPPSVCTYTKASVANAKIPLVIICGYHVGLTDTMNRAQIKYTITEKLSKEDRYDIDKDWIKFKDGYVVYTNTYESSLLMNGLKDCSTDLFSITDIDNKNMYLEFFDNFGGRIKADSLDNFYDLFVDPMIKESLEFYKLPTDYIDILLYGNSLMGDNKYVRHVDTSSRKLRRYQLIAVYTYLVLSSAYGMYSIQLKHSRQAAEFSVKQSAVIDMFLTDSITSDDSCINALRDVETTNAITTKGPSGMNEDRAYSLDKRSYDDSMLNVLGMSTGFAGNVGITRQTTINPNVTPDGYIKKSSTKGKMNDANSLTATEAMIPFGSTRDDPMRTAMSFIQTAKHMVRTEESDPLLVTSGADEVMPYITTDKFAFKAKNKGTIKEVDENHILIEYENGKKDFISLRETIEKNSDGGYYVPLKLDMNGNLKPGMKFDKDQILAYDKYSFSNNLGESNNLAYNIGKLAKVAILNTDEGFEDSGIISSSMAKKLATRIDLKYDTVLEKDSTIYKIAKVGDHIEAGDELLIWQDAVEDEDAEAVIRGLSQSTDVSDLGKRKLKSEVTGTLQGIKIYRTVETEEMSDSLRKIVVDYEKPLKKEAKVIKDNNLNISKIPAHYVLPPTGKLKKAQNAVLIEFYVEYYDTVGVGDKIVYNSANKAVEKNIFPQGKEPYTDFRPNEIIDAFVAETSIDKRLVTSTFVYGALQKLMIELDRSVKDIMGIPYDDSTV